jgi:anti-sigma-K factor RskA
MADEEAEQGEIEAYALGTLSREAARALEVAMRDSAALRRQVAEARAVAALLAESPDQRSPSPNLRARVLAAARANVESYALGTLSHAEANEIEWQSAASADVQAQVRAARAVVRLLAESPEPLAPSADLKARVLAAARAERRRPVEPPARPDGAGRPAAPVPLPTRSPMAAPARGWLRTPPAWMTLVAAACLLLSIGLGAWIIALQQQVARQQAELLRDQAALQATAGADRFWTMRGDPAHAPDAVSTLALNQGQRQTALLARGFPPLPPDQTYQVWLVQDGRQVPIGSFAPPSLATEQVLVAPSDLAGVMAVTITIEPAGGSPSPTGPVVMAGDL